ncbi:hypothetical protein [Nocardia africana]|uniref:DUF222 domain-containing protein n=1 Tax=Nocardia africana TaxID=134964 RepID=A0ABW6NSV4_9NOCA
MDQSLSVNPAELRASAAELERLADEAALITSALRATLEHEGHCWGADEPGKTFAHTYAPDAERGLEGLENLTGKLRALRKNAAEAADAFEHNDMSSARAVQRSGAPNAVPGFDVPVTAPTTPFVSAPSHPISDELPGRSARHEGQRPDGPAVDQGRSSDDRTRTPDAAAQSTASPIPAADGNESFPVAPDTHTPPATGQAHGDAQQQSSVGVPATAPAAPSSATTAAQQKTYKPSRAGTPWARNAAGTPWTGAPGATDSPATAGNTTPPRVASPRTTDRPAGPEKPAPKRDGAPRPNAPRRRRAAPARPRTAAAAASELAQDMAARHGLDILGFDSGGVSADTVREIAAALDVIRARYPVPLRGIEITSSAEPYCEVENRAPVTHAAHAEPWITVSRAAAVDPILLTPPPTAGQAAIYRERPLFAAMVRALGATLEMTCGSAVRKEAQRTLIREYLRLDGVRHGSLARVVRGYKLWRDQLGPDCFRGNVFAPSRALAVAFAAGELTAGPEGPARVLHGLLVSRAMSPETR